MYDHREPGARERRARRRLDSRRALRHDFTALKARLEDGARADATWLDASWTFYFAQKRRAWREEAGHAKYRKRMGYPRLSTVIGRMERRRMLEPQAEKPAVARIRGRLQGMLAQMMAILGKVANKQASINRQAYRSIRFEAVRGEAWQWEEERRERFRCEVDFEAGWIGPSLHLKRLQGMLQKGARRLKTPMGRPELQAELERMEGWRRSVAGAIEELLGRKEIWEFDRPEIEGWRMELPGPGLSSAVRGLPDLPARPSAPEAIPPEPHEIPAYVLERRRHPSYGV